MKYIQAIWTYFSNLGVQSNLSSKDIRITKLINRFAFVLLTLIFFSFFYQLFKHLWISGKVLPESVLMLISFLPFVFIFYFNEKRKYFFARLIFILHPLTNTLLWMFTSNSQAGNIHYSYLLFPIPIIILFKELRTQIVLIILAFFAFVASHLIIEFVPPISETYSSPFFPVIVFGVWIGLSFIMLRFFVEEIESTQEKLEQKNIELQEFSQIASHDLKEPIRTIKSFSKLIRRRYSTDLSDGVLEYLEFIEGGAERMDNLLKDLSDYSMLDQKKQNFEEVDLNNIFKGVIQDLQYRIKESNATITSNQLPVVNANPNQMMQVFQNLINNGIKFQPLTGESSPEISVNCKVQNEYYVIDFQDNGIGIPKESIEAVFSKFKRLHSRAEYEGTGLGLATCKKIIERHRGFMTIESVVGKGTLIKVHLMK